MIRKPAEKRERFPSSIRVDRLNEDGFGGIAKNMSFKENKHLIRMKIGSGSYDKIATCSFVIRSFDRV